MLYSVENCVTIGNEFGFKATTKRHVLLWLKLAVPFNFVMESHFKIAHVNCKGCHKSYPINGKRSNPSKDWKPTTLPSINFFPGILNHLSNYLSCYSEYSPVEYQKLQNLSLQNSNNKRRLRQKAYYDKKKGKQSDSTKVSFM